MNHHTLLRTVISGSYRKHLDQLMKLKTSFEFHHILVLSPVGSYSLNPKAEFILLDADPIHDHRLLQDSVFAKIRTSSFLTLANMDGYMGNAALMEIGYAISLGLQILTLEPVEDPNIIPYCRPLQELLPKVYSSYKQKEVLPSPFQLGAN